jgi:fatty acid desaturase
MRKTVTAAAPTFDVTLDSIDYAAFANELDALRRDIDSRLGEEDLRHLRKMARWGRFFTGVGYATAWLGPNLVSMACLAQGNTARWTMLMHHVGHRGYDKVPGVPAAFKSTVFAQGSRRVRDWLDWMDPEAWAVEHNVLHHFRTGELADPDLVEENLTAVRDAQLPQAIKYAIVGFFAFTWKLTYYAPNTLQVLRHQQRKNERPASTTTSTTTPKTESAEKRSNPDTLLSAFDLRTETGRAFARRCLLPYGGLRFVAAPLAFSPLGPLAVASVFVNTVGAELLANLQSFLLIAPNHAGDDVYRFEGRSTDRAEFYVRQVAGSVNYRTGGDVNDFFHGFLNYQIEHHLFPDLPMLRYQELQPKVRAVCEKYGVPYVQESVFRRAKKLVDVMVGRTSMRAARTLSKAQRRVVKQTDQAAE